MSVAAVVSFFAHWVHKKRLKVGVVMMGSSKSLTAKHREGNYISKGRFSCKLGGLKCD